MKMKRIRVGLFTEDVELHGKNVLPGIQEMWDVPYRGFSADVLSFFGRSHWSDACALGPFDLVVFDCLRDNHGAYRLASTLVRQDQGMVIFSLTNGAAQDLVEIDQLNASLRPPRRTDRYLSTTTEDRMMARILRRERVVCRNVIAGSKDLSRVQLPTHLENLGGVFKKIHERCKNREQPICAVVGLPRSGSMFLADFVNFSVPLSASVFHEHEILSKKTFGKQVLPDLKDPREGHSKRVKAELTNAFRSTGFKYLFITERSPVDRLPSYFVKTHLRRLRFSFDAQSGSFTNTAQVRDEYIGFLKKNVRSMRWWYEEHWPRGLNLRLAELPSPRKLGYSIARAGSTTIVLIMTDCLNNLIRSGLLQAFNSDNYPLHSQNSSDDLGYGHLYDCFCEQFEFPRDVREEVFAIREVAAWHSIN